jgi:hypothetical protein
MSIQVWHQPESGRIASKLQVARGWDSTFPALPALPALPAYRRIGVSAYRRIGRDMMQKRDVRPVRDDRNGRLLVSRARLSDYHLWSIVPFLRRRPDYGGQAGTDSSLKTLTQHFVLGYFY